MPRPAINLDPYKEEIIELYQNDITRDEIVSYLLSSYNVNVSIDTLQRRLNTWDISKRIRTDDSSQLRARIATLFFECCASDEEILYILDQEGYTIGKWGLRRLRKKLGLGRRVSRFDREEADQRLREIVQEELDKGSIEGYGRGFLYHHFRNQMHLVSR